MSLHYKLKFCDTGNDISVIYVNVVRAFFSYKYYNITKTPLMMSDSNILVKYFVVLKIFWTVEEKNCYVRAHMNFASVYVHFELEFWGRKIKGTIWKWKKIVMLT